VRGGARDVGAGGGGGGIFAVVALAALARALRTIRMALLHHVDRETPGAVRTRADER